MPRINPFPKHQRDVGRNLSRLRQDCYVSRGMLAQRSHVSADAIKQIELGRVILAFQTASRLLDALAPRPELCPINPLRLAFGKWPMHLEWPICLPTPEKIGLPNGVSFYDYIASNRKLVEGLVHDPLHTGLPESWLQPYFAHWLRVQSLERRIGVGVAHVQGLLENSASLLAPTSPIAANILADFRKAAAALRIPLAPEDDDLTKASEPFKRVADVKIKSQWPGLKKRLQQATEAVGMKPALAKALDVDPTQISQWLSDKATAREPGGDYALRMLKWVELQEGGNQ